jgi:hypothetical protein
MPNSTFDFASDCKKQRLPSESRKQRQKCRCFLALSSNGWEVAKGDKQHEAYWFELSDFLFVTGGDDLFFLFRVEGLRRRPSAFRSTYALL